MTNRNTQGRVGISRQQTKHSQSSVRSNAHWLDWSNKPIPFKIYPELEQIRLDPSIARTEVPALLAVSATEFDPASETVPDPEATEPVAVLFSRRHQESQLPGWYTVLPCGILHGSPL